MDGLLGWGAILEGVIVTAICSVSGLLIHHFKPKWFGWDLFVGVPYALGLAVIGIGIYAAFLIINFVQLQNSTPSQAAMEARLRAIFEAAKIAFAKDPTPPSGVAFGYKYEFVGANISASMNDDTPQFLYLITKPEISLANLPNTNPETLRALASTLNIELYRYPATIKGMFAVYPTRAIGELRLEVPVQGFNLQKFMESSSQLSRAGAFVQAKTDELYPPRIVQ